MRITVKQQILLAPATILLLLLLLLGFMHYTYWDLNSKRRSIKAAETTFVALAEADMAARRLHVLLRVIQHSGMAAPEDLALIVDLYERLLSAIGRIEPVGTVKSSEQIAYLADLARSLNPAAGLEPENTAPLFAQLRAELSGLSSLTQNHRNHLRQAHEQDINQLVERTVLVTIGVLIIAVLLGLSISIYFSRRILSRIQTISANAARIADGSIDLPPVPERIQDEMDVLARSINRMATRLIQVVGTEKLLEGAEEERRRIAMDLHDQSLSDLSGILRGLQSLSELQTLDAAGDRISGLERDLHKAIANLRDIMNNLHPQTLDILGLGAAIEAHIDQLDQPTGSPACHLHIDSRVADLKLDRIKQLTIYRVAIEAIQNVHKHAAASRYEVNLELREATLVFSVEDNGCGFNSDRKHEQGRGLNNIRERARAIGAQVQWKPSRFSSGTRFELTLDTAISS
ncbi:sensor histidine kinase [Pelovirga terrestris]|uniref:HAMP domain-containing protein n=1 Tax=Pelovirga terrestris TaxID=2771352 RepID=A0A8J6QS56_9BACT|nr:ATP-binding protein [Pelovirga terrestris]MBD1400540.1 HAMP domain-containing protein [Pelovirga terrestris]